MEMSDVINSNDGQFTSDLPSYSFHLTAVFTHPTAQIYFIDKMASARYIQLATLPSTSYFSVCDEGVELWLRPFLSISDADFLECE